MICPTCGATLERKNECEMEVDVCPECSGIWFDAGELEEYSARPDRRRVPEPTGAHQLLFEQPPRASKCPWCGTTTLQFGWVDGFEAGRCTTCSGVWFNPSRTTSTDRIPRPRDYTVEKAGGPSQGLGVVGEIAEIALFLFLWE